MLAPLEAFAVKFNSGDVTFPSAAYTDDCTTIDEFAPFSWDGNGSIRTWYRDTIGSRSPEAQKRFAAHKFVLKIEAPLTVHGEGSTAYIVAPALLWYTRAGVRRLQHLEWVVQEVNTTEGWRIKAKPGRFATIRRWSNVDALAIDDGERRMPHLVFYPRDREVGTSAVLERGVTSTTTVATVVSRATAATIETPVTNNGAVQNRAWRMSTTMAIGSDRSARLSTTSRVLRAHRGAMVDAAVTQQLTASGINSTPTRTWFNSVGGSASEYVFRGAPAKSPAMSGVAMR